MKASKVFFVLLLCLILCFSMVACGPQQPTGPENPGEEEEGETSGEDRYKIETVRDWEEATATLYDGFSATFKLIDTDYSDTLTEHDWDVLCENPERYESVELSGTEREETLLSLRYDGNRLLCDWNDELESKYKDVSVCSIYDSGLERVWNGETRQYDYYIYRKDADGEWMSFSLECGTTITDDLADEADSFPFIYFNPNLKKMTSGALASPNQWWFANMYQPFSGMFLTVANQLSSGNEYHEAAKYQEATHSYRLDKGVVTKSRVVYADDSGYYRNHSIYSAKLNLLVQNFEIKFDNGKCLSLSFDGYILTTDNDIQSFSCEIVSNSDFVELPGGGHGRGLDASDRTEAMENASSVINGAIQPTNFTKSVSVTPDKNKKITVGEEYLVQVTNTAIRIKSKVYIGDIVAGADYIPSMWEESETYNSLEDDTIYYYSQQNGIWEKKPDAGQTGSATTMWKEMQDEWYKFLCVKYDEEIPTAPSTLYYDAENDVYWSTDGYCIRVGDHALWSRLFTYKESSVYIFVKWEITDINKTTVTLPEVG